jgi:hypothetical protein
MTTTGRHCPGKSKDAACCREPEGAATGKPREAAPALVSNIEVKDLRLALPPSPHRSSLKVPSDLNAKHRNLVTALVCAPSSDDPD